MRRRYTTAALLALDILCSVGVFNLATLARGLRLSEHFLVPSLLAPVVILIFAVYLIDGYSPRTDMLSVDYASQHAIAFLGALTATLLLTFVFVTGGYELQTSRLVVSLSFAGIAAVSLGYRRMIYLRRLPSLTRRGIVFVGNATQAAYFREECAKMGLSLPIVYTSLAPNSTPSDSTATASPVQQTSPSLESYLGEIEAGHANVEAIVLRESSQAVAPEVSRRLVQLHFAGIPTYTLELFHQVYWRKIPLYRLNPTWLFQEGFKVAREPLFARLKRASDLLLSLAGIFLTAPVIVASAFAIWLDDRGPAFFVQTRIGRNRMPFRLFKLRTMRVAASSDDPYTRANDSRITRVGRFLRMARIDEIPQLWNVLRGEMSLIGPRAEWDRLVETYEREIASYHFRHVVKPGITGWAQVNYPYGSSLEDTIRKLEYDLYYIRYFSFTLDAAIVLKTIHVMLFGRGR